jgi:glyceraldehyde-3-phosphate dehydrogenase/erythrose-4-phosphate dehydrogenase
VLLELTALDGFAIRVPTINVSIVDLSFIASATSVDAVTAFMKAAEGEPGESSAIPRAHWCRSISITPPNRAT